MCFKYRTALHWAAKRNHLEVAHCLLLNGADKIIESFAKEIPADLSTSPALLNLLGSPKMKVKVVEETQSGATSTTTAAAAITPHYMSLPNLGYQPSEKTESTRKLSIPNGAESRYPRGIKYYYISVV